MYITSKPAVLAEFIEKSQGDSLNDNVMSLDDRLLQKFSQLSVHFNEIKQETLEKVNSSQGGFSNPQELINLQQQALNYNLEVSLVSTLTRKATGAIETLLRS